MEMMGKIVIFPSFQVFESYFNLNPRIGIPYGHVYQKFRF